MIRNLETRKQQKKIIKNEKCSDYFPSLL